jgi:uncharacterized coiled-coil DUF342 family protein
MAVGKLIQTEVSSLGREPNSMALINTDRRSLEIYKKQRAESKNAQNLHDDVEQLKNDMKEIKDLLVQIARG